ncbi:MAG: tetratricopeptide repeat protein [Deltaproteobacteria bacterium]|nr:tetratricopeptide repeat protein [Deltaproteobacteria bacterium]
MTKLLMNDMSDATIIRISMAEAAIFIVMAGILAGGAYMRNHTWGNGFILWADAVAKSPSKSRPHTNLGMLRDLSGDIVAAEEEYKRAISLEPDYVAPYGPLAVIYGKRGDTARAIGMFRWVLDNWRGNDPRLHTGLGIAYMDRGLFREAEEEFKKALVAEPRYEIAHYNLARLYDEMGLKDLAMRHYMAYRELAPAGRTAGRQRE